MYDPSQKAAAAECMPFGIYNYHKHTMKKTQKDENVNRSKHKSNKRGKELFLKWQFTECVANVWNTFLSLDNEQIVKVWW